VPPMSAPTSNAAAHPAVKAIVFCVIIERPQEREPSCQIPASPSITSTS
jgi:hypothetical protein